MSIFRLACIDPDTVCAGLAVFEAITLRKTIKILYSSAVRPPADESRFAWETRAKFIAGAIGETCQRYAVDEAILEMPMIFQSAKGVAASNSGSMEKLLFATGVIYGQLQSSCELINPQRWKGNVPKSVTAMRVKRHWGFQSANSDVTDAVGMGDWYFRKYKKTFYQNYKIVRQ